MPLQPDFEAHDLRQQREPTMVERPRKSCFHGSLEARQRRPLIFFRRDPDP